MMQASGPPDDDAHRGIVIMSINELERRRPRRQQREKSVSPKQRPAAASPPPVRKPPRRYLRKMDLCRRYGWKTTLSVDRAWQLYGTLPPPTLYQGRSPLWDETILDAHDRAAGLRANA
jgi:hypothetical protein